METVVNHPAVDETWPWIPEEMVHSGWGGNRQGVSPQGCTGRGRQGGQGRASGNIQERLPPAADTAGI